MVAKIFYNKISERANIQKKTKKRKSYSLWLKKRNVNFLFQRYDNGQRKK